MYIEKIRKKEIKHELKLLFEATTFIKRGFLTIGPFKLSLKKEE